MSASVTVRPGDSYSSPTWMSSKYRRASAMRALEYHADTTLRIGGAMERRHFLPKTAVAAGATAVALADAPNVIAQQRLQWRMSTTWTPAPDVLPGAAQKRAQMGDDRSAGLRKTQA